MLKRSRKEIAIITCISLFWLATGLTALSQNITAITTLDVTTQSHLTDFLNADQDHFLVKGSEIHTELERFIQRLEDKRSKYKHELDFLEFVYYKVHRKYLDHYRTPVTMKALFEKHQYDCLTGTALYAIIFEALQVDYQITETTYHIYLTLKTNNESILIESTNPIYGFITDPQEINKLKESYVAGGNTKIEKGYYHFRHDVNQTIDLKKLAGLHFYNLALSSYNSHQLKAAILQMEQALNCYQSPRLAEVMQVMLLTLDTESNIDPSFKEHYLQKYAHLQIDPVTSKVH